MSIGERIAEKLWENGLISRTQLPKFVALIDLEAEKNLGNETQTASGLPDEETGKAQVSLDKISIQTICSALRLYADSFDTHDQAGRARRARALYICEVLEQEALPVSSHSQSATSAGERETPVPMGDLVRKHEWSKGLGSENNPQVGYVPECIHCGVSADDWGAADKPCPNAPPVPKD